MVPERERPHPRCSDRRGVGLEDAADNFAVGEHVEIVIIPFAGRARGRCAFEDEVILFHRKRMFRTRELVGSRVAKRTDSDPGCGMMVLFGPSKAGPLSRLPSPCPAGSGPSAGLLFPISLPLSQELSSLVLVQIKLLEGYSLGPLAIRRFDRAEIRPCCARDDDAPASLIGRLSGIATPGHGGKITDATSAGACPLQVRTLDQIQPIRRRPWWDDYCRSGGRSGGHPYSAFEPWDRLRPVRMARPAILDSFSHFPHTNARLVHIYRV